MGKKERVGRVEGRAVIVMDSISYIGAEERGTIVISGSHGGTAAARYALAHPPFLAVFSDAGVGKENAGVIALEMLDDVGVAAAAVSHASARIGDGMDTWTCGVITHVNGPARALGLQAGQSVQEAIAGIEQTTTRRRRQ